MLILLVSNSLTNGQNGTVCQKSLPRVSCVNELMDRDIRDYLEDMGHSEKTSVCYWNLYHVKGFYDYGLTVNKGTLPPSGDAFLQYGNDLIVIHGEPERDVFKMEDGQRKKITMEVKDTVATVIQSPYLIMKGGKYSYYSIRSFEDPSNINDIHNLYLNTKLQNYAISQSSEPYDIKLNVSLNRAVCTNRVLDAEIVRYLAKFPTIAGKRFWNISIDKVPDLQGNTAFFVCNLHLEPYSPEEGTAYLEYGNDIIILKKESDLSLFSILPGKDIDVRVIRNRMPWNSEFPYLSFRFREESPIDSKCYISSSLEVYGQ